MKRLILIAITTLTLLTINGLGSFNLQAQSLEQEVQGIKISKAYPNPAQDYVQFNYTIPQGSAKVEIQFFNMIGEVVLKQELQANTSNARLSISKLQKGVYFYRLVINNKTRGGIQKLIVK
ncbi:MAG: T9SS type A sorting domain-containing protein [Flammeovirgaceae bacterium]